VSVVYRRVIGVTERIVGENVFLAHPDRGTLYRLNRTVSAFWNALSQPCDVDEVVELFRAAFPKIPVRRLREDVATMVSDLLEEDLIEPMPEE
jgi:hypothetical protein